MLWFFFTHITIQSKPRSISVRKERRKKKRKIIEFEKTKITQRITVWISTKLNFDNKKKCNVQEVKWMPIKSNDSTSVYLCVNVCVYVCLCIQQKHNTAINQTQTKAQKVVVHRVDLSFSNRIPRRLWLCHSTDFGFLCKKWF